MLHASCFMLYALCFIFSEEKRRKHDRNRYQSVTKKAHEATKNSLQQHDTRRRNTHHSLQRTAVWLVLHNCFTLLIRYSWSCGKLIAYSINTTSKMSTKRVFGPLAGRFLSQSRIGQRVSLQRSLQQANYRRPSYFPIQRSLVTVTKSSASTPIASPIINESNLEFEAAASSLEQDVKQNDYSILITSSAVEQIIHLAKLRNSSNPQDIFLRVYVDAGGCSGFQYKFELENEQSHDEDEGVIDPDDDITINCSTFKDTDTELKARVIIDKSSLDLLRGSTVDFVREMIRSSFAIVANPQSESACGCGSSFAVKNFESNPALD